MGSASKIVTFVAIPCKTNIPSREVTATRMELKIHGLSKTYSNGVKALSDVSLTIRPGMFGLLGPNGAGKSTFMRTLATLQQADSGTAHLGTIDVLNQKDEIRKVLGYLPQEFGLYPKVSAVDMLDHFATLKGLTPARYRRDVVNALLKKTNLYDVRFRKLGAFSGGMKQRFGIAQALLGNPQLIIVDEPTAGLDPEERGRFHSLLSDISEQIIVILSTHIVSDVSDLCQDMAVMNQGRVAAQGHPLKLIEAMRGRIWRKFVPKEEVPTYQAALRVISVQRQAGQTVVRVESATTPDATFEAAEPSLEDVYFSAIRGGAPVLEVTKPAEPKPELTGAATQDSRS
jgi:ABC-2 type transport system ATP-binding protein